MYQQATPPEVKLFLAIAYKWTHYYASWVMLHILSYPSTTNGFLIEKYDQWHSILVSLLFSTCMVHICVLPPSACAPFVFSRFAVWCWCFLPLPLHWPANLFTSSYGEQKKKFVPHGQVWPTYIWFRWGNRIRRTENVSTQAYLKRD